MSCTQGQPPSWSKGSPIPTNWPPQAEFVLAHGEIIFVTSLFLFSFFFYLFIFFSFPLQVLALSIIFCLAKRDCKERAERETSEDEVDYFFLVCSDWERERRYWLFLLDLLREKGFLDFIWSERKSKVERICWNYALPFVKIISGWHTSFSSICISIQE